MALVRAFQVFVKEGYSEIKEKSHWWSKPEYVRKLIRSRIWVSQICDESEAEKILEEKIKNEMQRKRDGRGRNFEGWSSYRKYLEPGEYDDYPNGGELEMRIDYIRDWKMEKIIEELDGKQFAMLCKELGISAGEAMMRP